MDYGSGADRSLLGPAVRCGRSRTCCPFPGFYKDMTQNKISRKGAKETQRQKEICVFLAPLRLLLRLCVKLLLTECYNAIDLFTAQLSRASNGLHARPPEQL